MNNFYFTRNFALGTCLTFLSFSVIMDYFSFQYPDDDNYFGCDITGNNKMLHSCWSCNTFLMGPGFTSNHFIHWVLNLFINVFSYIQAFYIFWLFIANEWWKFYVHRIPFLLMMNSITAVFTYSSVFDNGWKSYNSAICTTVHIVIEIEIVFFFVLLILDLQWIRFRQIYVEIGAGLCYIILLWWWLIRNNGFAWNAHFNSKLILFNMHMNMVIHFVLNLCAITIFLGFSKKFFSYVDIFGEYSNLLIFNCFVVHTLSTVIHPFLWPAKYDSISCKEGDKVFVFLGHFLMMCVNNCFQHIYLSNGINKLCRSEVKSSGSLRSKRMTVFGTIVEDKSSGSL